MQNFDDMPMRESMRDAHKKNQLIVLSIINLWIHHLKKNLQKTEEL